MQASDVITNLEYFRWVLYSAFAGAAIVVFDYVLTFELENCYMWSKQRWSLIRVLFFINRYMPFVDITLSLCNQLLPSLILSNRGCTLVYRFSGWSFCFSIALSEVILTIRTWTLWKASRWSGIALVAFYLSCWVPIFVIFGTFLTHANVSSLRLPQYAFCILDPGNDNLYLCWGLVLVYDTGAMISMVRAGTKSYAQLCGRYGGSSALVRTLYRDGVTYYIALFIAPLFDHLILPLLTKLVVLSVANIITIVILPRDLVNLLSVPQRAIHATLSSRVILHLREQAEKRTTFSDSLISTYHSTEAS